MSKDIDMRFKELEQRLTAMLEQKIAVTEEALKRRIQGWTKREARRILEKTIKDMRDTEVIQLVNDSLSECQVIPLPSERELKKIVSVLDNALSNDNFLLFIGQSRSGRSIYLEVYKKHRDGYKLIWEIQLYPTKIIDCSDREEKI